MTSLAEHFFEKYCDGKSVSNDHDEESHYAKASCPEGTPIVKVHYPTDQMPKARLKMLFLNSVRESKYHDIAS